MFSKETSFIIFFCLLIAFPAQAQKYKEPTPLHQFFKNNCDSTIIYYNWSDWDIAPRYYILAKTEGEGIWFFTYTSPYMGVLGYNMPGGLVLKFLQEHSTFSRTPPDTNRYFLPYRVESGQKVSYWREANSFGIWNLQSVSNSGITCDTYDNMYDTYYLITKNGFRTLEFYASDYFESCEPSNSNRVQQIKTREVIRNIFRQDR